ncbi:MAG TPA: class II aldolase/adducin family protein, partial [Bacteroidales bacterium]|nr:class II aldolase/adducin family protein [Bacteroidales bacterium]
MKPGISELTEISRFYGSNSDYVIAGGGNTSYKDENTLWIKASGQPLAELTEEGLVALNREKLGIIAVKAYSEDPAEREEQVKNDLFKSVIDQDKSKRPSVETSLHDLISYKYVVHLHPTIINGLLCSRSAKNLTLKLFGDSVLFVPYTDPGYTLFKKLESELNVYRQKSGSDPHVIFLENHGSFVAANTNDEIRKIYADLISKISEQTPLLSGIETLPYNPVLNKVLPVLRMLLSKEEPVVVRSRHNTLIERFYQNQQEFHKISIPLTPDIIVYCKARYLYIEQSSTPERIIESFKFQLPHFISEYGYNPKLVIIKGLGVFAFDKNCSSAETALNVYEDLIKICHYALLWGGIKYLTPAQVQFIDN